jgi:hypothetical protein
VVYEAEQVSLGRRIPRDLGRLGEARHWLQRLRTWQTDAASFWDLQELALLRGEAGSLLLDAEFPSDPFPGPRPR